MFTHKVRRFSYQEHQHVPGGQPRPLHPGADEAGPLREADQADLGGELLRDVALKLALAIASKLIRLFNPFHVRLRETVLFFTFRYFLSLKSSTRMISCNAAAGVFSRTLQTVLNKSINSN